MNCTEARQHWNLFHDSEGDAELHFRIGEHLATCPRCAEWFHQQSRLEELLVEKLAVQAPTPTLWAQVLVGSGIVKRAPARRWLLFGGLAACAAALMVALWGGSRSSFLRGGDIARMAADWHERLTVGDEPLRFRSQSDLDVDDYLRHAVSFPVRCPPRKDAGFAVQGAGTCQFKDEPAAYLAGQVDTTPVSIFVLPYKSLDAFPKQRDALRANEATRYREGTLAMVMGVIDKNAVLVVGHTQPERLERVLQAYGTYPDHH